MTLFGYEMHLNRRAAYVNFLRQNGDLQTLGFAFWPPRSLSSVMKARCYQFYQTRGRTVTDEELSEPHSLYWKEREDACKR